jgi:hypothetical protein
MEKKLSIIIPYRNRNEHLKIFLNVLPKKINIKNYDILIVEQGNDKPFNRGKLLNIGFDFKKNNSDYFCFHDVDMIPKEINFEYVDKPTHGFTGMKHLDYRLTSKSNYGGVNLFNKEDFIKINGYSNEFWGWGGEDNDLLNRVKKKGFQLHRRFGHYENLIHERPSKNTNEYKNNLNKLNTDYDFDCDGLNNLTYNIKSIEDIEDNVQKIIVEL